MTIERSRRRTTKGSNAGAAAPKPQQVQTLRRELDAHREELATQNDDLRRANAALSAVKERYAQLYDAAPLAHFTVDERGTIIEANLAGAELFDAPRNFLFGRNFDELVVPSSRAAFREFRKRALEHGGRPVHDTVLSMGKRRFPAHMMAARIGSGGSLANECLLCVTDETEQRRLDAERRTLEARVAETQRLESLGVLAGGIANDFQDILAVALASADVALLDRDDSPRPHEAIRTMRDAVSRATELSTQMLAYTGRGSRNSETLDLSSVVRSISRALTTSVPNPNDTLILDLADDLPSVVGDAAQIEQIVLNLVANAGEAIARETGKITVRTRAEPTHSAEFGPVGGRVVIEVSDNGSGMDEATRLRAFDPFFSTKVAGRGLGLAVVHGNVQAHGGTVTIDTRLQAGTTVCVYLPASPALTTRSLRAREV